MDINNKYCVYRHYIGDNTFYVGMGSEFRAHVYGKRNKIWHKMVEENNKEYKVEIVKYFNSKKEAIKYEVELTKQYKNIGQCEANIAIGYSLYGAGRKKETKEKISTALKNRKSPMLGRKHKESTKNKMSNNMKGCKNPMYGIGEKHPSSKTIIVVVDGKEYKKDCIKHMQNFLKEEFGISTVIANWFRRGMPEKLKERITLVKTIKDGKETIHYEGLSSPLEFDK